MHAHGDSVAVVLKESDETAGVLVSALEQAVSVVKTSPDPPSAPENEADAPEADAAVQEGTAAEVEPPAPSKEAQPPPTPKPAPKPAPPAQSAGIPLMVRFKAWWDGVDPQDIIARTAK